MHSIHYVLAGMLYILQCLHIYWYYLFLVMGAAYLRTGAKPVDIQQRAGEHVSKDGRTVKELGDARTTISTGNGNNSAADSFSSAPPTEDQPAGSSSHQRQPLHQTVTAPATEMAASPRQAKRRQRVA